MERKRKNDYLNGKSISKTPEVGTAENDSVTITPNNRVSSNGGKSNTPGTSRTPFRNSPRRRSASSTPDSLTQRELKKLEDYWTRNDPVKEDSPRLRSNRKVIFNLKDCFGERNRAKRSPKSDFVPDKFKDVELTSLPESPIPEHYNMPNKSTATSSDADSLLEKKTNQRRIDQNEGKTLSDHGSPNIFTHIKSCFSAQGQSASSPESQTKMFSSRSPVSKNNEKQTGSRITIHSCDNTVSHPSGIAQNVNELDAAQKVIELDTSSDSDDDDYIPPRKKLRSEVTKDELWDGIPLTISFKRLAPISKTTTDKPEDFCQINKKQFIKSEEKQGYDQLIEKETEFKKQAEKIHSISSTEPKRSARLREKVTRTPVKISDNTASADRNKVRKVDNTFTSDQDDSPTVLRDIVSGPVINETNTKTCSEKLKAMQDQSKGSFSGNNLLRLTISQILSVDTRPDDQIEEALTEDNNDKKNSKQFIQDEDSSDPSTSASVSISKTITDIFSDISGPTEHPQSQENESKSTITDKCKIVDNEFKITRRSRRLSDLEKRKSGQNSPILKTTIDNQETLCIGSAIDTYTLTENEVNHAEEENASTSETAEHSSSKHKLFSKNTNKCTKTVPPLRIKLKQPLKGVSKTNCPSKSKKTSELKNKRKTNNKSNVSMASVLKTVEPSGQETDLPSLMDEQVSHTTPKQPSVAEKKGFTPKNKKKKLSKERKCRSPPSTPPLDTIALRLNNERRLSAAGNLLSNPVLNKHACVLWSSENRRHMQLSNPKATLSELDTKLSLKWDRLSDKERLRYFQRARDAIKDENRHSSKRRNDLNEHSMRNDAATTFSDESSVENFQKLSPASQMFEIKKWLNFYNEVSPGACAEVISSFKETLVEENRNKTKKDIELEKSKTKSKKNKQKKKEERIETTDSNSNYRKILFEKILDKKEHIIETLTEKKQAHHRLMLDAYCTMLRRMVCGEVVQFVGDVKSDKLTETLVDVKALEKESKLAITGDRCEGKEYEDILARLSSRNSPNGKSLLCALEDTNVNDGDIENICQKIESLPTLSPKTLQTHLSEVIMSESETAEGLSSPVRIGRGSRTSPVTVLTEWVADDLIACQPQIGFRKAISLLSNKIVPSPAIILPPPKVAKGSRPTANKNQNCNIVFTKLQKSSV